MKKNYTVKDLITYLLDFNMEAEILVNASGVPEGFDISWSDGKALLIEKLRNTHIGRKQDKEWIQKRTGKQKGENHPYAKRVSQYDLQGNFIREYNLVKEAAEANGLKLNNVSACLRGKSKTSGGYIWKYANLK